MNKIYPTQSQRRNSVARCHDPVQRYLPRQLVRLRRTTIASCTASALVLPSFTRLILQANLRDIRNSILLLYRRPHVVRQLARHLGRVDAAHVAVQPLPLGHPRLARVGQRDEALKDLRCAAVDLIGRALQVQELFAVGAALVAEALVGALAA